MRRVRKREHLLFNFLTFLYFRRTEGFRFLMEGGPFAAFIVVPYVMLSEVYFFRQKRYFVLLEHRVVGAIALEDEDGTLYVSSMAVSPDHRRMGIGIYALNQAAAIAGELCKEALELTVLKRNTPAIRLYKRQGFRLEKEKSRSVVLRKHIRKLC